MKNNDQKNAGQIICNHVWFTALPGFLPLPFLDVVGITAIQMDMIRQLCRLYEKDFEEQRGKAVTTALFSSLSGRLPGYAFRSTLKAVPIVGWVLGGMTMAAFAGASTYATGMVFKEHFEQGGTLNDLNPDNFAKFYRQEFEKAKKKVKEWLREGGVESSE